MTTPIIYLVSPPYSGSTLLALLLATHPDVATIGERGHFYRKIMASPVVGSPYCSCGRLFAGCDFWQTIKAAVAREVDARWLQLPFSTFQLINRPRRLRHLVDQLCLRYALADKTDRLPFPLKRRYQAAQYANAALIRAVLATRGARVFLDSSKVVEHAVYLDRTTGFQVRAIHLVRDGRAQVHSTLSHHPERDAASAGRQWMALVHQQAAILDQARIPYLTVKYETLCAAPQETLASICDFCDLDPDRVSLHFRQVEQHLMGNPMRLESSQEIVDKQSWRSEMTPADLRLFDQVAGEYNRSLGYGA
ncbi:MAG: sulfotransferase [Chloroflexi bacterium]|nr:sulfotransferase [Chloroflexota bacterium]MCI0579668.1 sulfotransferase [Chloroflexota bacterium]MCI0645892.1 sulfotransferase [Chloroflexota bacterium]MCI0725747.1 sulfotransferase [Chloroflexota bacterium]